MTAWKRYAMVGGLVTLVILAFGGYHGVGRNSGDEMVYENDSESRARFRSGLRSRASLT